jgi:hypothetical protein
MPQSREEVEAELRRAAEAAYGPDRAADLADEIRSAAGALHRVVTKPLDLRESPPPLG